MHNGLEEATIDRLEPLPGWFWPTVGLAVVFSSPYYLSLQTFFSHDDFVILWFHKDWSIYTPWVFLNTDVLTFYRPLQSYVCAVLFHFFGMNPFPYCLLLLLIHITTVVLFGRLVDRLFNDRSLTFLSVIFYAANWQYCTVVYWKANYGTALSWLFVLGAANALLNHLQSPRRAHYGLALAGLVAALLSKETAVNAPLLFTLIYGTYLWRPKAPDEGNLTLGTCVAALEEKRARIFWKPLTILRLLGPFYLLVGAYVLFHHWVVRDVYEWLPKGYTFADPVEWFRSIGRAFTVWLTWWLEAGIEIIWTRPGYPSWMVWLKRRPYLLPVVLLLVTAALRNRRLLFGMLWCVLAFLPANLLRDPHAARYYYGSIMGVALIYAELFLAADRAIVRRWSFAVVAPARVVGALLILAFVQTSMFYTTSIVRSDESKCRAIEDVYRYMVTQRGKHPPKSLFLVRCLNQVDHFHYGMGLRELFKLALDDDEAEAIFPGQDLTTETLAILLNEYPPPIELVLVSGRFQLRQTVVTTGTATTPPTPGAGGTPEMKPEDQEGEKR